MLLRCWLLHHRGPQASPECAHPGCHPWMCRYKPRQPILVAVCSDPKAALYSNKPRMSLDRNSSNKNIAAMDEVRRPPVPCIWPSNMSTKHAHRGGQKAVSLSALSPLCCAPLHAGNEASCRHAQHMHACTPMQLCQFGPDTTMTLGTPYGYWVPFRTRTLFEHNPTLNTDPDPASYAPAGKQPRAAHAAKHVERPLRHPGEELHAV